LINLNIKSTNENFNYKFDKNALGKLINLKNLTLPSNYNTFEKDQLRDIFGLKQSVILDYN